EGEEHLGDPVGLLVGDLRDLLGVEVLGAGDDRVCGHGGLKLGERVRLGDVGQGVSSFVVGVKCTIAREKWRTGRPLAQGPPAALPVMTAGPAERRRPGDWRPPGRRFRAAGQTPAYSATTRMMAVFLDSTSRLPLRERQNLPPASVPSQRAFWSLNLRSQSAN